MTNPDLEIDTPHKKKGGRKKPFKIEVFFGPPWNRWARMGRYENEDRANQALEDLKRKFGEKVRVVKC